MKFPVRNWQMVEVNLVVLVLFTFFQPCGAVDSLNPRVVCRYVNKTYNKWHTWVSSLVNQRGWDLLEVFAPPPKCNRTGEIIVLYNAVDVFYVFEGELWLIMYGKVLKGLTGFPTMQKFTESPVHGQRNVFFHKMKQGSVTFSKSKMGRFRIIYKFRKPWGKTNINRNPKSSKCPTDDT